MGFLTGGEARPPHANCAECGLAACPIVFSSGPETAEIVLVGEAPGDQEVRWGEPFVGKAGKLLDQALVEAGMEREALFITNACLCRPIPHRAPAPSEINACRPRLLAEIKARKPKVVVALGDVALRALTGRGQVGKVRGQALESAAGVPVVPTWHPAAALRMPRRYPDLVHDLQNAIAIAQGRVEDKPEFAYRVVDDVEESWWPGDDIVTIDVETASDGRILCVGLWYGKGPVLVVRGIPDTLRKVLHGRRVNGHNLKYELRVLHPTRPVPAFDTMLANYVLDGRVGVNGLEDVIKYNFPGAEDYWTPIMPYYKRMEAAPEELVFEYNAKDVWYTHRLMEKMRKKLTDDDRRVLTMLLKATVVLADIERRGVRIDEERLAALPAEIGAQVEEQVRLLREVAGETFNPQSPQQVAALLYDQLGLPDPSYKRSTAKEVLQLIKDQHPVVEALLRYRRLTKMLGTYVESIAEKLVDGRLHGSFNLHTTASGRLSSSGPNLQNIPKHGGEEAKMVRGLFIADPGYTLLEADFSQAELRVLAYYCRDENLMEAIGHGVDIHKRTASLIFGVREDEVTGTQRQVAKTVNFLVLYGGQEDKLIETVRKTIGMQMSRREATEVIQKWFDAYPKAAEWIASVKDELIRTRAVRTPLGRVRRWPVIDSAALREGVNFPIQSLASDITLLSLIYLHSVLPEEDQILLTVHDSILLQTRRDVEEVGEYVKQCMLKVAKAVVGDVPFDVEVSAGHRWSELEPLDL